MLDKDRALNFATNNADAVVTSVDKTSYVDKETHPNYSVLEANGKSTLAVPLTTQSLANSQANKAMSNNTDPQSKTRAVCSFCGKCFSHLGDYNKHRRRHTGEQPYSCDLCPRRFAHASNLTRHRRLHSGDKPFECIYCSRKFGRKDKLATHMARRSCCTSVTN